MTADKPHKKSARVVGDVMAVTIPTGMPLFMILWSGWHRTFHTLPLVDGHGNFGNIDGDSAAAMRYTEARLSNCSRMLRDIEKETVDFIPNYDET